jgi:murein DD-endopeptidase MepM/ murein hydrolase activator NlpD
VLVVACTPSPKYVGRGGGAPPPLSPEEPPPGAPSSPPSIPDRAPSIHLSPPLASFSTSSIRSRFGRRRDPRTGRPENHQGLDIKGRKGEPVLATAAGKVAYAGWQNGFGRVVILQHEKGLHTVYAHLSAIHVRLNETVSPGKVIGTVGSSGSATGPHLHFEVRRGTRAVDPLPYLLGS